MEVAKIQVHGVSCPCLSYASRGPSTKRISIYELKPNHELPFLCINFEEKLPESAPQVFHLANVQLSRLWFAATGTNLVTVIRREIIEVSKMLTLAHHFDQPLTWAAGTYRARVYGYRMNDGRWSGSLVFVPVGGGRLIATERETTQSSLADLTHWAAGLSEVYMEGALARGLALQPEAQLAKELARLEQIEASAEIRADALDRAATAARTQSRVAEAARERTEEQLLETIAENAEIEAEAHEQAATESRTVALTAERALRTKNPTPPVAKKKQKQKKSRNRRA